MTHKFLRKFVKGGITNVKGNVALEFAMIAPIFFLLMFATIEVTLAWFANVILENGLKQASRQILTGQAQTAGLTSQQFRDALCNKINSLLSCAADKLYIDVRAYANFAGANFPNPINADGSFNGALNAFDMGGSSQVNGASSIVLARAFYKWQLLTPMIGEYYANMADNTRLLSSSVAFRNEPF